MDRKGEEEKQIDIDSEWRELVERARLEKVVNGRERGMEGRDRVKSEQRKGQKREKGQKGKNRERGQKEREFREGRNRRTMRVKGEGRKRT